MKHVYQGLNLLFWLAVCQLPGWAGASAVRGNLDWYYTLAMPPFTPPDRLFGAAWSVLYLLLGAAAFMVFRRGLRGRPPQTAVLFFLQLALNACWTPLFFGLHQTGAALALLAVMLLEGIWLFAAFKRASPAAARMLLPYGIWLVYAGYLNAGVWLLNA